MAKGKRFTEHDLAAVLASDKLPRKERGKFLEQYSAASLEKALYDGNKKIDIAYIVKELVRIKNDPDTDSGLIRTILMDFKELILLGAVQTPAVLEELQKEVKTAAAARYVDPFAGFKVHNPNPERKAL